MGTNHQASPAARLSGAALTAGGTVAGGTCRASFGAHRGNDDFMMSYPMGRALAEKLQAAQLVLRTMAVPPALDEVDVTIEQSWTGYDFVPAAVRAQLRIAVAEIIANIIEHGSRGRHRVLLELRMSVAPDRVVIVVTDDGNELLADPAAVRMPTWPAERGRGLAMAQSALDELAYRRKAETNHWVLISKRFAS